MASPTLDEMNKGLLGMQDRLHKMHGSAEALSESFTSIASVLPKLLVLEGAHAIVKNMVTQVKDWASTITNSQKVREHYEAGIEAFVQKLQRAGHSEASIAEQRLDFERKAAPLYQARLQVAHAYEGSNKLALKYLEFSAIALAKTVRDSAALNDALIKSNSSLSERYRLMVAGLSTTTRTGQSLGDVLEIQRSLVNAGIAINGNYQKTLETVVMLHKGLGMSVDTATHLAIVVNSQVRGSFQQVSDVLANIVNQTALTADEAGRMAKELGTLLSMTRGQSGGAMLPEMTRAVARYEDALKRMTGTSGGFTELIKKVSGPQGFGMAGMLGVRSPELLNTQAGIDTLMRNFKRLGDTMVGESQGWQRRMGLEALANIMGTSAEEVNGLYLATKNLNAGVTTEMTLRDRYLQQTSDLTHNLSQLGNRLMSVIERGLTPFVYGLNMVFGGLNSLIDSMSRMRFLTNTLSVLAVAAVPVAVFALSGLIKALYNVALASTVAKVGLAARGSGGMGIGGMVMQIVSFLANLNPLVKVIAVAAGIAALYARYAYQKDEETRNLAKASKLQYAEDKNRIALGFGEQAVMSSNNPQVSLSRLELAFANIRNKNLTLSDQLAKDKELFDSISANMKARTTTRDRFSEATMAEREQLHKNDDLFSKNLERLFKESDKSARDDANKQLQEARKDKSDDEVKWFHTKVTILPVSPYILLTPSP